MEIKDSFFTHCCFKIQYYRRSVHIPLTLCVVYYCFHWNKEMERNWSTEFCTSNIARASHVKTRGQTIFAIDIVEICRSTVSKRFFVLCTLLRTIPYCVVVVVVLFSFHSCPNGNCTSSDIYLFLFSFE